ncbi:MAG: hypothetical protein KC620_02220 [Myxococcales bacterium]|nr:hypothetical protein [Myxococcales bacterium]
MSATLTAELFDRPNIPNVLGRVVAFVADLLCAPQITPAQRRMVHLFRYAAETVGRPILAAEDREHLDVLLDEAAEDTRLHHFEAILGAELSNFVAELEVHRGAEGLHIDERAFTEMFGDSFKPEARLLDRLMAVYVAALQQHFLAAPQPNLDMLPDDLATLFRDIAFPPRARHAVLGGLRAEAALLAILDTKAEPNAHVDPWLRRALVEAMIDGRRRHLALVAGLPSVTVDLTGLGVVPLDMAEMSAQYEADRARLAALEASGQEEPFGPPIFDD